MSVTIKRAQSWIAEAAEMGLRVENPDKTEDDISLSPASKIELSLLTRELLLHKQLESAGLLAGRRVMFTGPPGTGKSLAAEVLASTLKWPLVRVMSSSLHSHLLGESAKAMARIMALIRSAGDVVWFFDEADAFLRPRQISDSSAAREVDSATNVLLAATSNPGSVTAGVMVFATNFSDGIDAAMWRRFDHVVDFALPKPVRRRIYIRGLFSKHRQPVASVSTPRDAWIADLVGATAGWSYAEIELFWLNQTKWAVLGEATAKSSDELCARARAFVAGRRGTRVPPPEPAESGDGLAPLDS